MGGYQPLEADGIEPSVGWEQFPTRTVGADSIRPQLTGQSRPLDGTSFCNCPLASPGGKLAFWAIGTSEPIGKKV